MTDRVGRWRRVEELCHAALDLPIAERAAFLTTACAGDDELRFEVESLLAHERTVDRFLSEPLGSVAAEVVAVANSPGTIDAQVAHYRIVDRLGAGGMGVIYRAEDTKLRRLVALKFLPADATRDEDAKRRFVTEAQAASALDHPNICTIYEIDETPDGQLFIAMAFYAGETLRSKIERGPLRLGDAVDYAIQVAQGLIKAHAAGIVHRDIKPANLLVTDDGLVKIVDFGIAKLVGHTGATRTGTTLGTLAYMSPEQLSGARVDGRSDVWSLGVVLYEMIAGRLPFDGEHPQAIALAVSHSAPDPLTAVRTGVPQDLERVVNRALAKNADDRYQTAADLLSELRRLQRETAGPPRSSSPAPAAGSRGARGWTWIGGAAVAAATIAALAFLGRWWLNSKAGIPTLANPVQVAGSVGEERLPSWSGDGRLLAYQSDQTGNNDIWITQLGGVAVNRTADFSGGDEAPRLSPDGRQIAFWSAREGGGIFLMPALGGAARKIAPGRADAAAAAVWSPDSERLAYPLVAPQTGGPPRMEILTLRTGEIHHVTLPRGGAIAFIDGAWSPDGRFIAGLRANSYNNQTSSIFAVRVSDDRVIEITDVNTRINWSPSWSPDSRTIFFTSNRGGTMDIWQQRIAETGEPVGAPDRLTTGLDALHATFTADGRRVAYAKGRRIANIWRVPIFPDRLATWSDAKQVTLDQRYIEAFDLSPDGKRLALASDRGGADDIWIMPSGGGDMRALTNDPTPDWWPAWSPDGREVAIYSGRAGNRELWVLPVEEGPARRLTTTQAIFPRWTPDGKSIVVSMGNDIAAVPATGGEPRVLMKGQPAGTMEFSFSPDGKAFAITSGKPPDRRIWRFSASGGDGRPLTKGQSTSPRWSPDGAWIYFTTFRDSGGITTQLERPGLNIWRVSPDGKSESPVTQLNGRRGYLGWAIATDGRWIYFTWREDVSDIWVMDVERGRR
jgi:Tol biopolymer transport system component